MATFQFWYDFSCPYAYIASQLVEGMAERTGATMELRPMLLGGVFRARKVPQNLPATLNAQKARHNANDIMRYAKLANVPLNMPQDHPIRTVRALRAVLVVGVQNPEAAALSDAFFKAYWAKEIDISTDEGLSLVLKEAGHDPAEILARIETQEIKDELRARTDKAIALGIFGAPAFIVEGALYWGQDRMDFVEDALLKQVMRPIDFYFDYSSPFSYIGAMQVDRVLGNAARWHPMLLGAIFKMVETPNVPLFAQSEAKQAYLREDIERQAERANIPFRWPSRFPMNTVLPLRVTLLSGAHETRGRALVRSLYEAYWFKDQDISDRDVVRGLCDEAGLDGGALVEGAQRPDIKERLKLATQKAAEAGVFGAPTFVVRGEGEPALFWGADRLPLVRAEALRS